VIARGIVAEGLRQELDLSIVVVIVMSALLVRSPLLPGQHSQRDRPIAPSDSEPLDRSAHA
jgi:hypothetical protein